MFWRYSGSAKGGVFTSYRSHIVETIIVGIKRRGIISKKNRESNQAVGLRRIISGVET